MTRRGPYEPKDEVEASTLEAAGVLGDRRWVKCLRCGTGYLTGMGHWGSDCCLAMATNSEMSRRGMTMFPRTYRMMLEEAGVGFEIAKGGLAIKPDGVRRYKGVAAVDRMYVPHWAVLVLKKGLWMRRDRRIWFLKALNQSEFAALRGVMRHVVTDVLKLPTEIGSLRRFQSKILREEEPLFDEQTKEDYGG